jgi:hypothetical protein
MTPSEIEPATWKVYMYIRYVYISAVIVFYIMLMTMEFRQSFLSDMVCVAP